MKYSLITCDSCGNVILEKHEYINCTHLTSLKHIVKKETIHLHMECARSCFKDRLKLQPIWMEWTEAQE